MNTTRRGKKRQDVIDSVSDCWNKRLAACIEKEGYTRKTFAEAYKKRYGTGNQTDVYRWVNVRSVYGSTKNVIGFPSYDTMKRIADFFGVTVGYLTGETDYETFEMDRACTYFGINEAAGKAIRNITHGKVSSEHLSRMLPKENTAALCYLLTADYFKDFMGCLCEYAACIDRKNHPVNYLEEAYKQITPELQEVALKWRDYDFSWNDPEAPEPTPELIDAIHQINRAIDKDFTQPFTLERDEKIAKYELYEVYLRLIDEIVCEENVGPLVGIQNKSFASVKELKKFLENEY